MVVMGHLNNASSPSKKKKIYKRLPMFSQIKEHEDVEYDDETKDPWIAM